MYVILLCTELTVAAEGVMVSLLISEKSSQVTAVMIVLLSFLFSGSSPHAKTLQQAGVEFIMDMSYARWTLAALYIAEIRASPALEITVAVQATNNIGFTNVTL